MVPILVFMPALAVGRRIIRYASYRHMGLLVSSSPAWSPAVRKSGPLKSIVMVTGQVLPSNPTPGPEPLTPAVRSYFVTFLAGTFFFAAQCAAIRSAAAFFWAGVQVRFFGAALDLFESAMVSSVRVVSTAVLGGRPRRLAVVVPPNASIARFSLSRSSMSNLTM